MEGKIRKEVWIDPYHLPILKDRAKKSNKLLKSYLEDIIRQDVENDLYWVTVDGYYETGPFEYDVAEKLNKEDAEKLALSHLEVMRAQMTKKHKKYGKMLGFQLYINPMRDEGFPTHYESSDDRKYLDEMGKKEDKFWEEFYK